jgi:hypothetical protein
MVKNTLLVIIAAIVLIGGVVLWSGDSTPVVTDPLGGQGRALNTDATFKSLTTTGDVTVGDELNITGSIVRSSTNSTSTTATTQTLVQADILGYETVLFTPNTGDTTLTFPATSTLTSFAPSTGDMVEQCWYNATSTADITLTFAAGTGMDLERVATSTTDGGAGVLAVQEKNSACFKFVRQADTDISVLMFSFINAD